MTRHASFKRKVRARMEKTGERYAAARQALLGHGAGSREGPALPAVPRYRFVDGLEQDLALLAGALAQAGVVDPLTGSQFSETRLFGLSGGIGFMSFLFEYQGHPPMLTFVCRSWSLPGPVISRALEHAGLRHALSETGSAAVAARFVDQALERGAAAHVTLDYASLPSSGMPQLWAGGLPRQANVVGKAGADFVVDLGGPALLDASTLARVRAAAKKEKHRAFTFEPGPANAEPLEATQAAVRWTARNLVEAPFANYASNFGLPALDRQARLCVDAKDKRGWPRVFDTGPLACLALYRTWECLTLELTAPAGGRTLYAEFLEEASQLAGLEALGEAAELSRKSAELFAKLADDAVAAAPEVAAAVELSEEIDELLRGGAVGSSSSGPGSATASRAATDDGFFDLSTLGEKVSALRAERDAVTARCTLDEDGRAAAYAKIGEGFAAIHEVEAELQRVLAAV